MGDVKLSYSLALGVGSVSLSLVFWCFALAFLVAGIFAALLLLIRRANLKTNFAFGPFLIVATWVSIYFYGVSLN
jgi:leader peptidase (prepilin peptidase)/N-methyltransferase